MNTVSVTYEPEDGDLRADSHGQHHLTLQALAAMCRKAEECGVPPEATGYTNGPTLVFQWTEPEFMSRRVQG